MPWSIEKRGEKYCVIKDTDGTNQGCHASRSKAEAQRRALYASEKSMAYVTIEGVGTKTLLVAKSISQRAFGLSRMELADLQDQGVDGMLFVYPTETLVAFHMAGMQFDLLIAFFDATGALVEQCEMSAKGGVHRPRRPFKYVVESPSVKTLLPANARLQLPVLTSEEAYARH